MAVRRSAKIATVALLALPIVAAVQLIAFGERQYGVVARGGEGAVSADGSARGGAGGSAVVHGSGGVAIGGAGGDVMQFGSCTAFPSPNGTDYRIRCGSYVAVFRGLSEHQYQITWMNLETGHTGIKNFAGEPSGRIDMLREIMREDGR